MKYGKRVLMYGIPKSLLFKIILFLVILLIGKNVFAQDFNVDNSNITSPNSGGTGKYTGTEIYNSGTSNVYNIGTRYNGQLSRIIFNLSAGGYADANGFEKGHTYTLTMNMATDDWRNRFGSVSVKCEGSSGQELSNGRVTYISYKKIKFSFTAPSSSWCQFVYIDLKSTNITNTAFTGVSNWNLSSMVITDPAYDSSSGSGSGSGSGSTNNNQDIIDSANKNTQDIINNNDKNTNDIIENNNSNTQNIIDNQNKNTESTNELLGNCYKNFSNVNTLSIPYISGNSGKLLLEPITNNHEKFYFSFSSNYSLSRILIMPYNSSGTLITTNPWTSSVDLIYNGFYGGYYYDGGTNTSLNITFNNTVSYFVVGFIALNNPTHVYSNIMISNSNMPFIEAGSTKCSSKLDETNTAINDVNNSINNSNVDSGTGSDFFNDFSSQDNGGISGIITKPLVLINSLLSNNNSCSNLTFGIQFPGLDNKTVSFPSGCILWNNVPSTVVNIYQIFVVGFCSYYLLKRLFKDVEDLKNPEKDNVEVIDL